jgi:hypothetical protein
MENFDPKQPSKGLGDTIAKITHYTGIAKVVEVVTDVLGIEDCGCGRRREKLNESTPYDIETQSAPTYDPNNFPPAEIGAYEILKQINATKGGVQYNFLPHDKVLITEEHL